MVWWFWDETSDKEVLGSNMDDCCFENKLKKAMAGPF